MLPYEKILELVEARQLDITTVSLAEITADFIKYIKTLEERRIDPDLLANFVAAAAKLLLIKSKTLLPSLELTEEEERDVKELESRLKFYQELKTAAGRLNGLWQSPERCYFRSAPALAAGFYPPGRLDAARLRSAFQSVAGGWDNIKQETAVMKAAVMSVESGVRELLKRLAAAACQPFGRLAANRPREEMIALFLAALYLLKDGKIRTEQKEVFGEIEIMKHKT